MDKFRNFGRHSKRVFNRLITKREKEAEAGIGADFNFITEVNEEFRIVSWKIENINRCIPSNGKCYESPPFSTGFSNEIKWVIKMYPLGRKSAEQVAIFIDKVSEVQGSDVSLKYSIEVKLNNADPNHDSKENTQIYTCKNITEYLLEVDKNVKSREYGKDDIFPSNYLNGIKSVLIRCQLLFVYLEEREHCIAGPSKSSIFSDNLKEMYRSGKFSDVTLQVGKKKLPAHKFFLAARSKVFAAMFNHEMEESKTNVIPIEDVDPSVMDDVLLYMYTGYVEGLTIEKAMSMFYVADKYSLEGLRNQCVGVMLAKLSVENVCQVATLADMHSVPELESATRFIFRKYMGNIFDTKEWKKILHEKQQLASDILQAISDNFITDAVIY